MSSSDLSCHEVSGGFTDVKLLVLSTHGTRTSVCLQCSRVQPLAFCLQRA